jgi:glutamate racemase
VKIGVFDSGAGGLTVVKSLLSSGIYDEIIYFGDTARVPYGKKDKATIVRYAFEAMEFFENYDIDLLIVACNTVSVLALNEMRQVGKFPIIGVVEPGVEARKAMVSDLEARILVVGTEGTIRSGVYQEMLGKVGYRNINACATGLFVSLVEEDICDRQLIHSTFDYYFSRMQTPDVIVLGCTHFPLLIDGFKDYFNGVKFVHSGDAIVDWIVEQSDVKLNSFRSKLSIFASDSPDMLRRRVRNWIGDEAIAE